MDKKNFINILDFGASKIRFAVFNNELKQQYSDTKSVKYNTDYSNHLEEISLIVKKAEKNIAMHIQDMVLSLDQENLFTLDLSFRKNFDKELKINKIYETLILELQQILSSHYNKLEIIHIIFSRCIIDDKIYIELPKDNMTNNIVVDFKVICFPKKIINNIKEILNKINVKVLNFFCTSYLKSSSYIRKLNLENASFLEIGYKRTNLICYEKKRLKFIQSIPIGGMHITKDIADIFKINQDEAEKVKRSFNKSETEFSYMDNHEENDLIINEISKKKISINLLKKVILYRIQEIIDISFKRSNIKKYSIELKNSDLFFIGDGSILLNKNAFYLSDKFGFKDLNFYDEKDNQICNSILVHYINNYELPKRNSKKQGLFEKFFFFFSK